MPQKTAPLRSPPISDIDSEIIYSSDEGNSAPSEQEPLIIDIDPLDEPIASETKLATTKKRAKKAKKVSTPSDEDRTLAKRWADTTIRDYPHIKTDVEKYATAIMKVKKTVGLNHEQMEYIFDFARKDDFWNDKIQSPVGLLRKGKNDLRKVDNILNQIKKKDYKYNDAMEHMGKIDRGEIEMGGGTIF